MSHLFGQLYKELEEKLEKISYEEENVLRIQDLKQVIIGHDFKTVNEEITFFKPPEFFTNYHFCNISINDFITGSICIIT